MVARRLALLALVGCVPVDAPLADVGSSSETGGTSGEVEDIADLLAAIDGLEVEERASPEEGYRYFVLGLRQPADHDDPGGPGFTQRMTLLHRDEAAPMVMVTAGYFLYPESTALGEPATLLAGNQLAVEHRFFPPSRPEPADWSTLTIAQAAADHHRATEAFRAIYAGPWVATGGSKSGMASVYFRRFYPDDVDATIAYVAPQSYGPADPRYLEFVATRGEPGCRAALLALQREVLVRRSAMVTRMQAQAEEEALSYEILGEDAALESAAVEFVFTFWQYEGAELCPQVPDAAAASDDEVWEFFNVVVPPKYWSDEWFLGYEPYFWQAANQLGYPAYDETNLADLLLYPGLDVAASYVLPDKTPAFDAGVMPDVAAWLEASGRRMMFVYGENDPYTAAAFEPGEGGEVLKYVTPGGNHGARILDLPDDERAAALAALEAWTGVTPVATARARAASSARARLRGHAW